MVDMEGVADPSCTCNTEDASPGVIIDILVGPAYHSSELPFTFFKYCK